MIKTIKFWFLVLLGVLNFSCSFGSNYSVNFFPGNNRENDCYYTGYWPKPEINLSVGDFTNSDQCYINQSLQISEANISFFILTNNSTNRPSWRQSENDVAQIFLNNPDTLWVRRQVPVLQGEECPYIVKGCSVADVLICLKNGKIITVEVKNYSKYNLKQVVNILYTQIAKYVENGLTNIYSLIDLTGQLTTPFRIEDLMKCLYRKFDKNGNDVSVQTIEDLEELIPTNCDTQTTPMCFWRISNSIYFGDMEVTSENVNSKVAGKYLIDWAIESQNVEIIMTLRCLGAIANAAQSQAIDQLLQEVLPESWYNQ